MKEYVSKKEYEEIVQEYENFKKIYTILKIEALEIQKDITTEDISYFCIISNEKDTYIVFYNGLGKNLIQVLSKNKEKELFKLFGKDSLKEQNVDKPNDEYYYRAYIFNYLEEPRFIKQILVGEIDFESTDLIKEIQEEINYYKDKFIEDKKEMFEYSKTNEIINKFKYIKSKVSDNK